MRPVRTVSIPRSKGPTSMPKIFVVAVGRIEAERIDKRVAALSLDRATQAAFRRGRVRDLYSRSAARLSAGVNMIADRPHKAARRHRAKRRCRSNWAALRARDS